MADFAFVTAGTKKADVPVGISYRIIELFSGGLYSSPNKAVEELVTNSYDALAQRVDLLLPKNMSATDAAIWVVDDGESMDEDGIFDLWRIAASRKRKGDSTGDRLPIGRFGIGKLATYVLARQLTYICKKDGAYLAITMNYDDIPQDADAAESQVMLDLRSLTKAEARVALDPMATLEGGSNLRDRLFEADAGSWTAVAMSELRPLAADIQHGRLNWILSTALPMSPGFKLFVNGKPVRPSVEKKNKPIQSWTIGNDDEAAAKLSLETGEDEGAHFVEIPGIGQISGQASVHEVELTSGKASEHGRSHGFFVKVRGRLINLDDALFGVRALSHTTFSRFRMEIEANGLDELLRSTREAVLDVPAVEVLRDYMVAKFNEARAFYTNYVRDQEAEARLPTRIGRTPGLLSRRPLYSAVSLALESDLTLALINTPKGIGNDEKKSLLEGLEGALESTDGLISSVEFAPLGTDEYLVSYDVAAQSIRINSLHPFLANYMAAGSGNVIEAFELIGVAEVLTEAYLLEVLPAEEVRSVIDRRDRFLRELVFSGEQPGAAVVAMMLVDAKANENALEHAVSLGFKSIGFEVTKLGKSGKPDGLASARIGMRSTESDGPDDYKLSYDAKSTGKERVKAKDANVAGLARHREDYNAQFAIVIAPDFEGGGDPESAISKECKQNDVTAIRVDDFALLVSLAATRQIGYGKLRELFENCRTPNESHDWIHGLLEDKAEKIPVDSILETIWSLMGESPDPVTFGALQNELKHRGVTVRLNQLEEWIESLRSLVPGYLSVDNGAVMLENKPEKLREVMREHGGMLDEEVRKATWLEQFIDGQSTAEE